MLISGSDDNTFKFWNLTTHTCVHTIEQEGESSWEMALSSDQTTLISKSSVAIYIWNLATYTLVTTIQEPVRSAQIMGLSNHGALAFLRTAEDQILAWSIEEGRSLVALPKEENSWGLCLFMPNKTGTKAVISRCATKIEVWEF